MTVYYTEDGNIMFRDLTGNSLEQGTDFILCDEGSDDGFGQIFKFDNVITSPTEGIFVASDDGIGEVYKLNVTPYGALSLEKDYRTLDEILEENEN